MIEVRPFAGIGAANHGWLDAHHHFSFASYRDPDRMGWGAIRVWNDDVIAPGTGFDPHPHRDMEIITYVRSGAITHKDSLGNEGRTEAGDVQVMSAGTGIVHSEYNRDDVPCSLFQIWVEPTGRGDPPGWGTRPFPRGARAGQFVTLASGLAEDLTGDALAIRADARLAAATLSKGGSARYAPAPGRHVYLVAATGRITVNGIEAAARDGVAIEDVAQIEVVALEDSEIVLVDAA